MNAMSNILAVARREFTVRVRTRSFRIGTAALVIGVLILAFVPVILKSFDRNEPVRIGVHVADAAIVATAPSTVDALLNGAAATDPAGKRSYDVVAVADLATGRTDVLDGRLAAILAIERGPGGDLTFAYYAEDPNGIGASRTAAALRQAASTLAITDRLDRLGITPSDRSALFSPAEFSVEPADPAKAPTTEGEEAASYLLGFGMTVLIFMMVILYGTWVAMSVVEEKSSRVMEVILNAATPFQLLTGKVLGVGAVALLQYGVILVSGLVALVAQGPVSKLILGESAGDVSLPQGLTPGVLLLLGVYGVLGFLLYAVLYAAAGSLVSRQEDVNQAVLPMTLVSTAGYLVAVYTGTGLLDLREGWLAALAQVPFFSPFMMLSRATAGEVALWEILLSVVLLAASIVGALWLAARIYAAGVLLYGQRPGLRSVWRLVRAGV